MKQILLLSAAYSNGNAYIDAGNTVELGDGKHQITEERALEIEEGRRGEISEVDVADDGEPGDDGDGFDAFTVPELKKYAADEGVDIGTARSKADILAAIRAPRD